MDFGLFIVQLLAIVFTRYSNSVLSQSEILPEKISYKAKIIAVTGHGTCHCRPAQNFHVVKYDVQILPNLHVMRM